jgi:hypothetical protein
MTDEIVDPEEAFDRALTLLDRDEIVEGQALIEAVIKEARIAQDSILLVRALCVLGEWMHELGRFSDAKSYLEEALAVHVQNPTLVTYEQRRARRLLQSIATAL